MLGLTYSYVCKNHGQQHPIVLFRNLHFIHLCPKCDKDMEKTYTKAITLGRGGKEEEE